jgi:TRAP-type C4-dicarboxylate transport system substrate-binding protein
MGRRMPRQPSRNRRERVAAHPAVRASRRAWPLVLAAKQRWDSLTPEQQERYRRMAREYGRRAQETLATRRRRKP